MQRLNRKEITIKTLLILISILSIVLIKDGVHTIISSINVIKNMGGIDIYPIDSTDTIIQGLYYQIITNCLFTLCPIIVFILSIVSIFITNRAIEISIMAQTVLMLILTLTSNDNYIEDNIGFYPLLAIAILVTLTIIIISSIVKKSLFVFYIVGLILLAVKYIGVYKFWIEKARESVSLLSWFNMYGVKYVIVTVLGFCILTLKIQNHSSKFLKS